MSTNGHNPVMLPEVLEALQPIDGAVYVDGTFGAGGYSAAVLEAADCTVIAIDRDPDAQARADTLKDKYGGRLTFLHGRFGDVEELLDKPVDGFVLDLGVSSFQLDEAERGFSFRSDGPLDMRMDTAQDLNAADIVNTYDEKELADLIYKYGEERHSRRVAKKIVQQRKEKPFETTAELAETVREAVPKSKDGIDPATRTFQALRIAVNDEQGELERALKAAVHILKPGGRMAVVSFHSLEDGAVKAFFRERSGEEPKSSRHTPEQPGNADPVFELVTRKALKPSEKEIQDNPRSRSARLRAVIRTEAAA